MQGLDVRVDGPAGISLFLYDNDTFIVESFRDEPAEIRILTNSRFTTLEDLETAEVNPAAPRPESPTGFFRPPDADLTRFDATIKPHSFRIFRAGDSS